jgi:hypothetical protein
MLTRPAVPTINVTATGSLAGEAGWALLREVPD